MQCIHCILFALILVLKHINSRKEFRLQCARFQNEWQSISQTQKILLLCCYSCGSLLWKEHYLHDAIVVRRRSRCFPLLLGTLSL